MKLDTLLRGTRLIKDDSGNVVVQSIGNMSLVFLTCDPEFSLDSKFGNPMKLIATNSRYGQVQIANHQGKDLLIAPQVAIMTDYAAQNHAMAKSAIIPNRRTTQYNDAGCVQGSQTGYLRGTGEETVRFIPTSIREMLYDEANKTGSYNHLYPAIQKLGEIVRHSTGSYLDKYFAAFDSQTQEFIAHFERPDNLIGVIVFINNEIVAIDKFPSFTYATQVWDALIRDCYGALAIQSRAETLASGKEYENKEFASKVESIGNLPAMEALQALYTALEETISERSQKVTSRLSEIMDVEFSVTGDEQGDSGEYKSNILKAEGYIGQVIQSFDYNHLVSIVKRERFDPEKLRQANSVVIEYRNRLSRQRNFSL